ncbi:MAG: class I tRNA ligase family protein, partial [Actinobacteria bacterium]|nr:class I tRNA ligase family protein [Actinomycetota bacterium]
MKKFSATTPIYYVNAKPHLGHAYTTIIADAVCRWHKLCGEEVHLLTGTDEHGLKIQQFADAEGISPKEFVDKIAPLFADAWDRLDIDINDFIRTTEERHKIGVQKLLQACYDAGDIEVDIYRGHYCVACEAYYTPEELDNGKCKIHNTKAEYVEEENYFFRLSRYEEKLLKWYADHPDAIKPDHRVNEVTGFIKQGLRDFSVSRKTLTWGIKLPWDDSHVAYVWFDALANYITAHGYGTDEKQFAANWPVDYHFIGKDIIRFHCVYWPAMLMSAGLEPPKGWAVGGWLLVGGEKMSKTTGNVVNPLDLIDEIGVDGFRYYVLADTNYGNDGDFSYEGLLSRYNSDLANNFGNLAARVATVVEKKCGGIG